MLVRQSINQEDVSHKTDGFALHEASRCTVSRPMRTPERVQLKRLFLQIHFEIQSVLLRQFASLVSTPHVNSTLVETDPALC